LRVYSWSSLAPKTARTPFNFVFYLRLLLSLVSESSVIEGFSMSNSPPLNTFNAAAKSGGFAELAASGTSYHTNNRFLMKW
jgi:hypothetical protein